MKTVKNFVNISNGTYMANTSYVVAQHNALHYKLTKWGKDLILSCVNVVQSFLIGPENLYKRSRHPTSTRLCGKFRKLHVNDGDHPMMCTPLYVSGALCQFRACRSIPIFLGVFIWDELLSSDVRKIPKLSNNIFHGE